ncbi:MAG TPA: DinB family protein [Dehalococcoidia bacterium]|nr:DinB family protein [Dehalococcoidia bacterium]
MSAGSGLSEQMAQKVGEIKQAVAGLNDEKASKPPAEGEWSVKQVLSHLCGDDDALSMYEFKRFLAEDSPDLGVRPGQYGDVRKAAPISELVSKIESDYAEIGSFLSDLSDEQLGRKARVAFLKDSPLGEYPTLGQWAGAVINFHLADHVNQLRTLAQ